MPATTTTKTALRSITLPCPMCGELEIGIAVRIDHLADGDCFTCSDCENVFGPDLIESIIRRWAPVLTWLEQIPQQSAE